MGRKKKTYSNDIRKKALMELMDGKEFSRVCTDNNIAPSTLSDWKKAFLNSVEGKDTRKLEKELAEKDAQLQEAAKIIGKKEMEIELLKKARGL